MRSSNFETFDFQADLLTISKLENWCIMCQEINSLLALRKVFVILNVFVTRTPAKSSVYTQNE